MRTHAGRSAASGPLTRQAGLRCARRERSTPGPRLQAVLPTATRARSQQRHRRFSRLVPGPAPRRRRSAQFLQAPRPRSARQAARSSRACSTTAPGYMSPPDCPVAHRLQMAPGWPRPNRRPRTAARPRDLRDRRQHPAGRRPHPAGPQGRAAPLTRPPVLRQPARLPDRQARARHRPSRAREEPSRPQHLRTPSLWPARSRRRRAHERRAARTFRVWFMRHQPRRGPFGLAPPPMPMASRLPAHPGRATRRQRPAGPGRAAPCPARTLVPR